MHSGSLLSRLKNGFLVVFLGIFCVFCLPNSSVAQQNNLPSVLRSRVYRLRNISAKDAKQYLTALKIKVTIDELPHNALIITSDNSESRIKVSSLLQLIDSKQAYATKTISGITADSAVTADSISAKVAGIEIGTFKEPPAVSDSSVIIDVHNSELVVVAPANRIDNIMEAVNELQKPAEVQPIKAEEGETTTATAQEDTEVKAAVETGTISQQYTDEIQGPPEPERKAELTEPSPTDLEGPVTPQKEDTESIAVVEFEKIVKQQTTEIEGAQEPAPKTGAEDQTGQLYAVNMEETDIEQQLKPEIEEEPQADVNDISESQETKEKSETQTDTTEENGDFIEEELFEVLAETEKITPDTKSESESEDTEEALTTAQEPNEVDAPSAKAEDKEPEPSEPKPEPETKPQTPAQMEDFSDEGREELQRLLSALKAEEKEVSSKVETTKTEVTQPEKKAETPVEQPKEKQPESKTEKEIKKIETKTPPIPQPKKPVRQPEPIAKQEETKKTEPETEIKKITSKTDDVTDRIAIPKGEEELELTITLPEKVKITELLELVGKQLGLNYMYDEKVVTGDITLKVHDGKIKVKDTYALLESALKYRGFVMTRRGNLVTIVKQGTEKDWDPAIITDTDKIQPGDIIVTSIFNLKYISTASAQKMLTNMKLGTQFDDIPETNTLIVTGYAYRMKRIKELLDMIDVKGEEKKYVSRQLKYLTPDQITSKLETLAEQLESVSIVIEQDTTTSAPTTRPPTRTTRTRTPTRPTPTRTTTAPQEPAKQGVYIDVDERTNRILMIGLEEDIKIIDSLIDSLDVREYGLKSIREYEIIHIPAVDVVDALNELGVTSTRVSTPSSTRPTTTTRPSTTRPTTPRPTTTTTTTSTSGEEPNISIRESTNTLLINATDEQHEQIALVIAHIDVEQKDERVIREYEIQHVDAAEVIDTLNELGISSQSSSTRSTRPTARSLTTSSTRTTSTSSRPPATATGPSPVSSSVDVLEEEPMIAVLEITNSLLINAKPRQHAEIALIIAHVDREPDITSTPYVIYALENQTPEELAAVLEKLVQETIEERSQDGKVQTKSVAFQDEDRITIVPDPISYSLVVYAKKKNQQWISELIKELDQYRPQVLLDCTLVEILKNDDFTADLDIVANIEGLGTTSGLIGSLGSIAVGKYQEASSFSGTAKGFYGDNHVQALLELVQTKDYGRILARPKLLVDDNQEGSIETKSTTYIKRTTTNIIDQDGANPLQTESETFDPYDASIKLDIKPHISKGNNLRLEITLSRSDFVNFVTGTNEPPDKTASDVTTVVTVPDGSTIILGGMDKVNQSKGGDKVPILGDIPIVGGLFRSTSNVSAQSKLYIFIKAHILRPGSDMTSQDLIEISKKNREEFEKTEAEMQRYEDWPGIKPQPMDPPKILEGD